MVRVYVHRKEPSCISCEGIYTICGKLLEACKQQLHSSRSLVGVIIIHTQEMLRPQL